MILENRSLNLRRLALASIYEAGSGHPGGTLSCIDIINIIYCDIIKKNKYDKFILSKGHAAPALYAAAFVNGLIKKFELAKLRKLNSPLQGHPSLIHTPWVEASTGSLGQGFSVAIGMALGLRHINKIGNIFCIIGDGELQEGSIWEGAMFASHYCLDNLCVFIDYNKLQSDDLNKNIIEIEPIKKKWQSFNWNVIEIDGHNFNEIKLALKKYQKNKNQPTIIIANTIKGKGVSFMENIPEWHGSVKITKDELKAALVELKATNKEIDLYLSGKIWKILK